MAEIFTFGKPGQRQGPPGGGFFQPPPPPGPDLQQDDYEFHLVDKVSGEEKVIRKRGHLVVTASNIVLFNRVQDMVWGIPNDQNVMFFERVNDGDIYENAVFEEIPEEDSGNDEDLFESPEVDA